MNRHDTDCVTIRCQRTRQPGYDAFKLVFAHFLLWLVQYNKGASSSQVGEIFDLDTFPTAGRLDGYF